MGRAVFSEQGDSGLPECKTEDWRLRIRLDDSGTWLDIESRAHEPGASVRLNGIEGLVELEKMLLHAKMRLLGLV